MAVACKCDRCGKLFETDKNARVRKIRVGRSSLIMDLRGPLDDEEMDLCGSCFEALDIWLHEYKKKEETSDE